jgi:hypothetical protein
MYVGNKMFVLTRMALSILSSGSFDSRSSRGLTWVLRSPKN